MDLPQLINSVTIRFIVLIALIIGLAIPTAMVWAVVQLRSDYEDQVSAEISKGWGDSQFLLGPVLRTTSTQPTPSSEDPNDKETREVSRFYTPATLDASSKTEHTIRSKGIFSKPVFTTQYLLKGSFDAIDADFANSDDHSNVTGCALLMTVSDTRSIRSLKATYNNEELSVKPAAQTGSWTGESVQAPLSLSECVAGEFHIDVSLRGSNRQSVVLVGDTSQMNLVSSWPHPKFDGRQLPDSHHIDSEGFTASWTANELSRGFPSTMNTEEWLSIDDRFAVGYGFHEPITLYSMVERAVKYGFFIIGLTMLGIFCVELITTVRFHPVQYGIVGAALTLFYLLLLSFSEHIGFLAAYLVASGTLTTLITGYSWVSAHHTRLSATICVLLIGIYAALYACLSSIDYALLIGSLLLVGLLIGLMYATRGLAKAEQLTSQTVE